MNVRHLCNGAIALTRCGCGTGFVWLTAVPARATCRACLDAHKWAALGWAKRAAMVRKTAYPPIELWRYA